MSDPHSGGAGPADTGDRSAPREGAAMVSSMALLTILLRQWRVVVAVAAVAVAVAVLLLEVPKPRYVAESVFMPENADQSGLSGLAAQFGVGTGAGSTASPRYYLTLLESNRLLRLVATDTVGAIGRSAGQGRAASSREALLEHYRRGGGAKEGSLREVVERLRQDIELEMVIGTPMLRLRTVADSPELALTLNRTLLMLLEEVNVQLRQSSARGEREFLESRMEEARTSLRAAEARLETYMEGNRLWQQSPRLQLEMGRLQRQIALAQAHYTLLVREYHDARIGELRNTQLITVVDPPEGSVRVAGPNPTLTVVMALFLGLVLGAGVAFALHYIRTRRRSEPTGTRRPPPSERTVAVRAGGV